MMTDKGRAAETSFEMDFEKIYVKYFDFLVSIAVRKFNVPETEAETLAHDVFLSFLQGKEEIRDIPSWLTGAICQLSRYYWRKSAPEATVAAAQPPETAPDEAAAKESLNAFPPRYRRVLRRRLERAPKIDHFAERFGVNTKTSRRRRKTVSNPALVDFVKAYRNVG